MFLNLHLSISHTQQTHTHTQHPVGLHRMVDQPIAEAAHNKHKRRTSMSAAEFEPAILAIKWLQTYALGRTATGVGWIQIIAGADSPKLTTRFHLVPMSGTRGTFKLCTSYVTMVGFVCNDAVQVLMKYCVTDCTQHFSIAWLTVVAVSGLVLWEIASTKGRCVCVCVCVWSHLTALTHGDVAHPMLTCWFWYTLLVIPNGVAQIWTLGKRDDVAAPNICGLSVRLHFMSPFLRLEFCGVFWIFGKFVKLRILIFVNRPISLLWSETWAMCKPVALSDLNH